ncbi:MAG TPA: GNAT family N-acetyltransferase [Ktedonobacterales bacterium]|nr:GNAT family N-acetyltransferase [Ktedonobacterales bacterium]
MTNERAAITIRNALSEDAPAIDAVLRALGWFTHLDDIPSSDTQAGIARVIAEKCSQDGDNTLLVAEYDAGGVVGYLFVHWLPNLIFGGEGYVSELFILPEARGQGIGGALLEEVKRRGIARGYQRLTLFNRRERESFQRGFYPKHGWVERDDAALFMYYFDDEG